MALKEREEPEEQQEHPELDAEPEARQPDDDELDVEVEQKGEEVVVKKRSEGTRGQRRWAEREAKRSAEMDELRSALAETRKTIQELAARGYQPPVQPVAPPPPKKSDDDLDDDYLDIVRQQDELAAKATRCRTQQELDRVNLDWHKLEKKRVLALAPKPAPVQDQSNRLTAEEDALVREFQPVLRHPHASEVAKSYWLAARARARAKGVPFNEVQAHREAMTKAGEEFGIFKPQPKPPSATERSRFAGERGGPTGGGDGPTSITLNAAEKVAARTWGSDMLEAGMSEAKVFSKYATILMKDKAYMESRKG